MANLSEKELFEKNYGLIKRIVIKFKPPKSDYDDYIQIASLGMVKAIRNYDPEIGEFSTLASTIIKNHLINYIHSERRHRGITNSISDLKYEAFYYTKPPVDLDEYTFLSCKQKLILGLRIQSYSFKEISSLLNSNISFVFKHYKRAIELINKNERRI